MYTPKNIISNSILLSVFLNFNRMFNLLKNFFIDFLKACQNSNIEELVCSNNVKGKNNKY